MGYSIWDGLADIVTNGSYSGTKYLYGTVSGKKNDNLVDTALGGLNLSIENVLDPGNLLWSSEQQRLAEDQFAYEKAWNKINYEEQKRQYEKNYAAELEAYNYQKSLNALQMEREDMAVQRRVADLEAAGLSPTLAAGSAATVAPVHAGTAPHMEPAQMQTASAIKVQAAMFKEEMMKERMGLAMSLLGNIADVSRTKAETEFIKAQKEHQDIINKYEDDRLSTSIEGTRLENDAKRMANSFNQLANPARLIEMRQAIDLAKKQIDIAELDKEIKTNEKLRQLYYNAEAKFKAALAGKQVELADLQKENIDWDTALKIYALEYAQDKDVPLSGNVNTFGFAASVGATLRHIFFGK